jgi:hypothetical protein
MTEPARTKCIEVLVEDQITIGLRAVLPARSKLKGVEVALPTDRRGQTRWRTIPTEGVQMGAGLAVRLLAFYGKGGEQVRSDKVTGEPLKEAQQAYLEETELEENDGYRFIVTGYGQGMTVVSTLGGEPEVEDDVYPSAPPPPPVEDEPVSVAAEAVRDGIAPQAGKHRRAIVNESVE